MYRVEHHTGDQVRLIAAGVHQLKPIARHLASQGHTGRVVLIDVNTREVIIRVPIEPIEHEASGDESHHGADRDGTRSGA